QGNRWHAFRAVPVSGIDAVPARRRPPVKIAERTQFDSLVCQRLPNPRIAERLALLPALGAVHRIDVVVQSRVASQVGDPCRDRRQGLDQPLGTQPLGPGKALPRVSIEFSAIMDRSEMAEWNAQRAAGLQQNRAGGPRAMHVLMRIEVRWFPP